MSKIIVKFLFGTNHLYDYVKVRYDRNTNW
jgi:hypothetical protein